MAKQTYEKVGWQNESTGNTPVSAENLDHMDSAIKDLYDEGATSKDIVIGGTEPPEDTDVKIWFPDNVVNTKASEVVNSMEGNETDASPSVHAVKKYINGDILYQDENGSNSSIVLQTSTNNYKELEIIGHRDMGTYKVPFYTKIKYPFSNKRIALTTLNYHSDAALFTNGLYTIEINDKNITKLKQSTYNIGSDGSLSITNANTTSMYITEIIGYKEVS